MKKNIKIAIDSPAGAGAGTQSKLISKHYNLFYLDTGKLYRVLAYYKLRNPNKFNLTCYTRCMKNIKLYILIFFFTFIFFSPAHAYLEPGTFSIVLQSILAVIAGIGATYRLWIFRIKSIFKKKEKKIDK